MIDIFNADVHYLIADLELNTESLMTDTPESLPARLCLPAKLCRRSIFAARCGRSYCASRSDA